jgi:carboxymethylenebutenolidase
MHVGIDPGTDHAYCFFQQYAIEVKTMKVFKHKIIIYLSIVVVLLISGAAFGQNPKDPAERNVSYKNPGGVTVRGYLATPKGSGRFPAVIMIHEWWGLNHDTTVLADALAEEGYVVLAADAFRGSVAQDRAGALKQVQGTPAEQIATDLDAAFKYLRSHPKVDPNRIASLGFCFGGTQSMYMGTRNPGLAAVVIFYGGGPITDPADLGRMQSAGPVLGIYGEEDDNIPLEQVQAFENALKKEDVQHTISVYPGVGHAFVKSDTYRNGEAAERAWQQMLSFLYTTLKP